jgi:hypothetical protein
LIRKDRLVGTEDSVRVRADRLDAGNVRKVGITGAAAETQCLMASEREQLAQRRLSGCRLDRRSHKFISRAEEQAPFHLYGVAPLVSKRQLANVHERVSLSEFG